MYNLAYTHTGCDIDNKNVFNGMKSTHRQRHTYIHGETNLVAFVSVDNNNARLTIYNSLHLTYMDTHGGVFIKYSF